MSRIRQGITPSVRRLLCWTCTVALSLGACAPRAARPNSESAAARHVQPAAPPADQREARIAELKRQLSEPPPRHDMLARERAFSDLGRLLLESQRYEEALILFHEATRDEPRGTARDLRYRRDYGIAAYHLGREDEAFSDAGSFNTARTHELRGRLLEKRQRIPEAIAAYREAVKGPNVFDLDLHLHLAQLLAESGKTAEAAEFLVRASPAFGRDRLLAALDAEPRYASTRAALRGREGNLQPKRPLTGADLGLPPPAAPTGTLDHRNLPDAGKSPPEEGVSPGRSPSGRDASAAPPASPSRTPSTTTSGAPAGAAKPARQAPVVRNAPATRLEDVAYLPLELPDLRVPVASREVSAIGGPVAAPAPRRNRAGMVMEVVSLREGVPMLRAALASPQTPPAKRPDLQQELERANARLSELETWAKRDGVTASEEDQARAGVAAQRRRAAEVPRR